MSLNSDYQKLRKKRKQQEEENPVPVKPLYVNKTAPLYQASPVYKEADIAPVKTTTKATKTEPEDTKKRTWFQGSKAFDDGYDFGDVTKTILGTGHDVGVNMKAGILGMGEKVVDAGAYLVGGAAKILGADDFADRTKQFVAKDLYDEKELAKKTDPFILTGLADTDNNSLFGEISEGILQSGGQLVGTAALQMAGVPWFVTSGVTSFGSETEQAFGKDASYAEAGISAAITAGAEMLTEKMFGGSGLGEKGLINLEPLTKGISSKLVKALADIGVDMFAEGAEEVVSEFAGNLGSALYKEENLGDILFSEEAVDGYIESFVGGAALGGGANVGKAVNSVRTGRDYRTGMNDVEQKVFDAEYNSRIADAEKDGKKLTNKQKAEIHDAVMTAMERGEISTDTIEEVLGGEDYKTYKETIDGMDTDINSMQEEYDALEDEYKELFGRKYMEKSDADAERQETIKQQMDALKQKLDDAKAKRWDYRAQTKRTMQSMVGKTRLWESYVEEEQKYRDFEADYTQYDGTKYPDAAKATIDNAIKAGANNTRAVRDLIHLHAKLSADTGEVFEFRSGEQFVQDFVDRQTKKISALENTPNLTEEQNKKLADMKALLTKVQNGDVTINGYISGNKIVLNLDSKNPLARTVGHELSHFFETAKNYDKLRNALYSYAKTKNIDLDSKRAEYNAMYEGDPDANIENEMVADMVGEAIFSDTEFIRNLYANDRNVFQKVWDEIKHLCKIAAAGSKELRELERVKHEFEKVYREGGKAESKGVEFDGVKHSLSDSDGKTLSKGQQEFFKDSKVRDEDGNLLVMYHGTNSEFTVFDTKAIAPKGNQFAFGSHFTPALEQASSHGNVSSYYIDIKNVLDVKHTPVLEGSKEYELALSILKSNRKKPDDWILSGNSVNTYNGFPEGYSGTGFYLGDIIQNANPKTIAKILKKHGYDGVKYFAKYYDNPVGAGMPKYFDSYIVFEPNQIKRTDNTNPTADPDIRYSLSDSDGKTLSKGQQEFFKDSKMRDDNGNLKVMYHGSQDAGFHVFDANKSDDGRSFFFVDRNDVAASYSGTTETYEARTIRTADDMNNFLAEIGYDEDYTVTEKDGKFELIYDGDRVATSDTAQGIYEEFCWYEGVGEGDANYKVYLNLKNPYIVDGQGFAWNDLHDEAVSEHFDFDPDFPLKTRDFAEYAKANGYDGVIFKNIHDNGGYSNGSEGASTVAVAFDSNQIKSVANETPTENKDIRYSFSSIANSFFGDENMTADDFRKKDYRQTEAYKAYVDSCVNNYRQTRTDFDEATARKEIEDAISGIVEVAVAAKRAGYDIYDDAQKRSKKDSKQRLLFSSLEPNSDYFTSNDISTICDKRKNFADIYDDIVRAEEAKGVPVGKRFFDNVDNYFYLHKVLADKGLTQPCRQCYVESMRKNLAPMASSFLQLVQETNPDNLSNEQLYHQKGKDKGKQKVNNASTREWVLAALDEYGMRASDLTVETLTTEDGLAALKIQAPMVYEAFNSFYGQAKPKMPKSATPFRFGELTALLTDEHGKIKRTLVDKINSTGGFRLQSYSDFQIQNFVDVLQVIHEAGTLGLEGHAYTKVPAFLDATEGTNLKRNISIFMYKDGDEWKLDRNDSFPYTLEEIYDIVNADKTGNTSIIAVSQNEDMSAWIMANDNVGYGIPFHKSGLKMGTVRDTIVRDGDREIRGYTGTKDHTRQQSEVWAKSSADHKALTKVKNGINIYRFWDFDNKSNLSKNELIEKNVKAYIDACEDAGYLPKFREYVMNNGKVLNMVLEHSKKLGFAPQDATIADISFEYKGYTIPYGYHKFLGDHGMFTPDGKASPREVLSLKNYDFKKAVDFFSDAETLRRNEILQQFANGEERQKYRDSNLTAEELADIVKQRRSEIVDEIVPTANSLSGESGWLTPVGDSELYGKDILKDIAPAKGTVLPDDKAPVSDTYERNRTDSITDADAPAETETYYGEPNETTPNDPFADRDYKGVGKRNVKAYMHEHPEVKPFFREAANAMLGDLQNSVKGEKWYNDELYYETGGEQGIGGTQRQTTDDIAYLLDGGYTYAQIEKALNAIVHDEGADNALSKRIEFLLNDRLKDGYTDIYGNEIPANQDYLHLLNDMQTAEAMENQAASAEYTDDIAPAQPVVEKVNQPVSEPAVAEPMKPAAEPAPVKNSQKEQSKQEAPKTAQIVYGAKPDKKKISTRAWAKEHIFRKGGVFEDLSLETDNRELQARFDMIRRSESMAQHFIGNGDGDVKALRDIFDALDDAGKIEAFDQYLGHMLNVDRMSLETPENRAVRESLMEKFKGYTDEQLKTLAKAGVPDVDVYLDALKHKNKPVWGDHITAQMSRAEAARLLKENPEFKQYAEDMYGIAKYLREMLVEEGLLDKESADMMAKMYPHYVPIHRADKNGMAINVPLDSNKTGVNNPIKRATGGNSDFYTFFDTMGERIEQTYRAIARNRFGIELKNTLDTVIEEEALSHGILPEGTRVRAHDRENIGTIQAYDEATGKYTVYFENKDGYNATVKLDAKTVTPLNTDTKADNMDDALDSNDELLQEGKNGMAPTFTVFENGKRVKFAITEEMYEALKPSQFNYTNKVLNGLTNFRTATLTQYSPEFMMKNFPKDLQAVLVNSQHPLRTYMAMPKAIKEIINNGEYYQERAKNGGSQDSYFDKKGKTFKSKKTNKALRTIGTIVGFPVHKFEALQNGLEQIPRLAEYIVDRKMGKSIDVAMLNSGRVTTNFGAAGDLTNMVNRNGVPFLGASVEGFNQQIRNIREAKAAGFKGWAKLAAKYAIAGIPNLLLNHLIWGDDDDYEELSDYVKEKYYIVFKYGDGKFFRIPKGREVSVIQYAMQEMSDIITGEEQAEISKLWELAKFAADNLAPNNPLKNNIASPVVDVIRNKTWYGEDLVPSWKKGDKGDQFDETTDAFSRWLGEKLPEHISPMQVNYLLDQYGGFISDIFLPMMTPKAESEADTFLGDLIAPIRDEFTTDSVMKNQNVTDFYDAADELDNNAESSRATEEDVLKAKYINSVKGQISDLNKEKRRLQNMSRQELAAEGIDSKYNAVREIQKQIDELAKQGLNGVQSTSIDGKYARVGDMQYKYYEPKPGSKTKPSWQKISDDELAKQAKVSAELGITASEYWNNKDEYDLMYSNPEKLDVLREQGITAEEYNDYHKDTAIIYNDDYSWAANNPERYTMSKAITDDIAEYRSYSTEIYNIKADKDRNGKSISGSRKEKVLDYINGLDLDYGAKLILFKNEYNADDTYNEDILDYLNGRSDISYDDTVTILKELGFEVDANGNVYW